MCRTFVSTETRTKGKYRGLKAYRHSAHTGEKMDGILFIAKQKVALKILSVMEKNFWNLQIQLEVIMKNESSRIFFISHENTIK